MSKFIVDNLRALIGVVTVFVLLSGIAVSYGALRNQSQHNKERISEFKKGNYLDHNMMLNKLDDLQDKINVIDKRSSVTLAKTDMILKIIKK